MFNKIYGVMKFIGLGIALVAVGLFISNGKYDDLGYSVVLFISIGFLLTTGIFDILSKVGRIKGLDGETRPVIIGHLSVLFGVCAMITTATNKNSVAISTTIIIIAIVMVFMLVMLYILLRIYKMMNDLVNTTQNNGTQKESENNTTDG